MVAWLLMVGMAFAQGGLLKVVKGDGVTEVAWEESLGGVTPGTVVLLGEAHGNSVHPIQQLMVMNHLRSQGLRVSVGMEFLEYTHQSAVDRFLAGQITEPEFLTEVMWSGFGFEFYRDQVLFPASSGGRTWALNIPRRISRQLARGGPTSLTAEQAALLPPQFERGSAAYERRFREVMGDHFPSPEAAENYFWAQSSWDDTMAWRISEALAADPESVIVVVVGEFHVQYGGGLPDRLRARGIRNIRSISQINLQGLSPAQEEEAVRPSTLDGPRADFLWISRF